MNSKKSYAYYSVGVALATQQQIQGVQQITATSGKPAKVMDIQQQQSQQNKPNASIQRPLSILPSSLAVQAANVRAASSVSTQTVYGVQATVQTQVNISTFNFYLESMIHKILFYNKKITRSKSKNYFFKCYNRCLNIFFLA